jgi:hypothetical protein
VDARVLGVILNNVKPEIGPDYFRYHTQYYYGRESELPVEKTKTGRFFQRLSGLLRRSDLLSIVLLTLALGLLLAGLFWQELFSVDP